MRRPLTFHRFFLYLLLLFVFLSSTSSSSTSASTIVGKDCTCLSQMIYDVIITKAWSTVTFVYAREEGVVSDGVCVLKSDLLPRLWAAGVLVATQSKDHYHPLDHLTTLNYVFFYSNNTWELLDQVSAGGKLDTSHWLVLLEKEDLARLHSHAHHLNLFIDSTFLLAAFSDCHAQIESLYRVGPKSGVLVEEMGEWSTAGGYVGAYGVNKYDRRMDFQGYPIQGIGVDVFGFFTTYLPGGELLSYRKLEGYDYGKLVPGSKSEWTGMVGELQSGRADLTVSELSITQERSEVITYTQPVYIISRKLYVSTPEDFQKKLLAYATPMDTALYLCVFASVGVLSLALYFIERLRLRLISCKDVSMSLTVAVWSMLSALLQQGCDTCPSSVAARAIFWLGFVASLIVYTSYSATLVSHLAVERPAALPFSDLRQLSYQTDWDAGVNNNDLFQVTASQTCVGSPTDECRILRDVWNRVVMRSPGNIVNSYSEGLQKVLEGEKIREMGLMNRLALTWLSAERSCSLETTVTAKLSDVATLFILLLLGVAASLIVLAGELMVSQVKEKNYRRHKVERRKV
ncbi:Glutamate receptor-like 62 [Homarus americanus]|uniref:Glutamate receptor-like 62 n=1 Tax=Homarus americanus TaxID=6706 RepID=A0A8J5JJF2_HOMAM|nr:Glutamate receptor-like 62 [Homarus americanus]